jgi:hypothetical protein
MPARHLVFGVIGKLIDPHLVRDQSILVLLVVVFDHLQICDEQSSPITLFFSVGVIFLELGLQREINSRGAHYRKITLNSFHFCSITSSVNSIAWSMLNYGETKNDIGRVVWRFVRAVKTSQCQWEFFKVKQWVLISLANPLLTNKL